MSRKIDGTNSDSNASNKPERRTIPELLRSISKKFRNEIRQQKEQSEKEAPPPEMRTKDVEHFDE